jgi:hypothetical protein
MASSFSSTEKHRWLEIGDGTPATTDLKRFNKRFIAVCQELS